MKVPFLDLPAQHIPLRSELDAAMGEVIDQCAFAGGPFVTRFEEEFAAFCNAKYAIGVGNGTDALWLSLLALDVGPGDEVITVPNTFMATAEAISYTGAKPVLVDVHPQTLSLNPELLEAAITQKTRAIIPVHLFGQTADMDPILAIAKKHGVPVIEDACQAHGAEYKGRKAGTLGVTGCFSFYPGKNLGALGEAGAVTTEDPEIYQKIKVLREHGQPRKYHHSMIGWNARMDGIQAAALRVKLKHLAKWNTQRRSNARQYDQLLEGLEGAILPVEAPFARHVYHLYPVQVPNRDLVLKLMADEGVSCGIHYPVPVHLQEAYRQLELGVGSFPVSEQSALSLISLPMYPELSQAQIAYVASTFRRVVAQAREHEYAA